MKKILVILAVVVGACTAEARPANTNGQWYVWEATNAVTATNALNFINGWACFPVTGKHPITGAAKGGTASTDKWSEAVQVRKDGKFCFERLTDEFCAMAGISEAQRESFFTTYNPQIEEYAEEWFN